MKVTAVKHSYRMSERERQIRRAAVCYAYGENLSCPEPTEPTEAEQHWLSARDCFQQGRQCAGWDAVERGDTIACPEYLPVNK